MMSNQKPPRDLTKTDFTPLQPDQLELLVEQLWEWINEQRTIVCPHTAERDDAVRDEAFRHVIAFIKGAVDSNIDGRLLRVDDPFRIRATIDVKKGFNHE